MSSNDSNSAGSDTSPFGFGRFVPGFDFLQNLAKGAAAGMPQMPPLSGWVAPTISVEELEKRISELKAVQFWLDQNSRALTATVQALEVQKMTLSTLQGMNVAMGDIAKAFTPQAAPPASGPAAPRPDPFARPPRPGPAAPAPAPEPAAQAPAAAGRDATGDAGTEPPLAAPGVVDPMQWWSALTGQFQQIAANAMSDVSKLPSMDATRGMAAEALKTATDMATQFAAQGMQGMQDMQDAARQAAEAGTGGARATDGGGAARGAKRPPSAAAPAPRATAAKAPSAKASSAKAPAGAPPGGARRAASPKPGPKGRS
ncbi:PhaM family polyhydroxyalkanoate granule multifunctional regulatory protein [Paracidovorax citrulli]|uniref:PhaM family polyhydroxyalkanoate granule multifunctional regulatory protein n=1 Tax=Paracidovorax citrulli TaxID=80869 RepID=UPI0005FB2FDF|nr:PhaM family polyhydroxyalkanoate granule multifunctional regulatory protein [Paracidovorax citrulli]